MNGRILTGALIGVCVALVMFAYGALQSIESRSAVELQGSCAAQAARFFKGTDLDQRTTPGLPPPPIPIADFQDHYDAQLRRCFVQIDSTTSYDVSPPVEIHAKTVADAFEGRVYADFVQRIDRDQPPDRCYVMVNGRKEQCASIEEFDLLARPYMGITTFSAEKNYGGKR
jgi:hypothetical protein